MPLHNARNAQAFIHLVSLCVSACAICTPFGNLRRGASVTLGDTAGIRLRPSSFPSRPEAPYLMHDHQARRESLPFPIFSPSHLHAVKLKEKGGRGKMKAPILHEHNCTNTNVWAVQEGDSPNLFYPLSLLSLGALLTLSCCSASHSDTCCAAPSLPSPQLQPLPMLHRSPMLHRPHLQQVLHRRLQPLSWLFQVPQHGQRSRPGRCRRRLGRLAFMLLFACLQPPQVHGCKRIGGDLHVGLACRRGIDVCDTQEG